LEEKKIGAEKAQAWKMEIIEAIVDVALVFSFFSSLTEKPLFFSDVI